MNKRETVTTTYQGEEIQCCKFTIDTVPATWRFPNVLQGNGSYAWQWVIYTPDGNKNVTLRIGNQLSIVPFRTSSRTWSNVFSDVDTTQWGNNVDIVFNTVGTYYCYHTKLEKGDTVTDWTESDVDITYSMVQQTANMLSWIVASGDSASTFTLTPRTAKLVSDYINLNGLVTFGALNQAIKDVVFSGDVFSEFQLFFNRDYEGNTANAKIYCYPVMSSFKAQCLTNDGKVSFYAKLIADTTLYTPPAMNVTVYQVLNTNSSASSSRTQHLNVWYDSSSSKWKYVQFKQATDYKSQTVDSSGDFTWASNYVVLASFKILSSSGTSVTISDTEIFKPVRYYDETTNSILEDKHASLYWQRLAQFCTDNDLTIINGGKLATHSVTADKMNVNSLQALSAILGGFLIVNNNITNTNSSTDITQNPQIKFERNTGNAYEYAYVIYSFPTYELYYRDVVTNMSSHYPTDVKISINDKGSMTWKYNLYPSTGTDLPEESDYEATPTQTYDNSMGLPLELGSDVFSHYYGNGVEFEVAQSKQIKMRKTSTTVGESPTLLIEGGFQADGIQSTGSIECKSFNNIKHDSRSVTIGANMGTGFALQYATDVIGNNPIVQITFGNRYFKVSSISVSTSGTNTIVTIGIVNESSSQETGMVYTSLFYSN